MSLTLVIQGQDLLENGQRGTLTLDRHGAVIGRSAHADWSLPDPKNHISSRHCEISYRDGDYVLSDRSTNGTYVNGSGERLVAPHRIVDGDRIVIGGYELVAGCSATAAASVPDDWGGWKAEAPPAFRPPEPERRSNGRRVAPPFEGGGWDVPAPLGASVWASEAPEAVPPSAAHLWGELARRDIETAVAPLPPEPITPGGWGSVAEVPMPPPLPSEPSRSATGAAATLLHAAGIEVHPSGTEADLIARAGTILRRMIEGLAAMVEARARAKAELGAVSTTIELEGNNPIKFIRAPERVLSALLQPPQPGFMATEVAIEDAFRDLQLHEMATVAATRAAMEQTLKRFSPAAIRERRRSDSWFARLMPHARAAALWRAYEDEFEGVVRGADEAFMDLFGKAFRTEYARCLDAAATARSRR